MCYDSTYTDFKVPKSPDLKSIEGDRTTHWDPVR